MNNNLENFIDTEAKSVEQLRAEAAAAEAEAPAEESTEA